MKKYSAAMIATAAVGMTAVLQACGTGIGGSDRGRGSINLKWVSSSGVVYIADTNNHRVRQVSASGTITTVAGTGANSFSGDGGVATSAALNSPASIVVDTAGGLYITDQSNLRIRKITDGVISTIGTGIGATIGIAADSSGNIYIADAENHVVRKITAATGIMTTVAGNTSLGSGYSGDGGAATSAKLAYPYGVSVDFFGNLYIADTNNHVIRRVSASTGMITTVAGNNAIAGTYAGDGGQATAAGLNLPKDVVVDEKGILYIADSNNHRIRKVNLAGRISTIAGTGTQSYTGDGGPATSATFRSPVAVALDSAGNLFISDKLNHAIRKIDLTGTISTVAGTGAAGFSGDGGTAISAALSSPFHNAD